MRGHPWPSKRELTMLSQALRTKPEAKLLEAARLACVHSRPGRWYPRPSIITGMDSRFGNVEGPL